MNRISEQSFPKTSATTLMSSASVRLGTGVVAVFGVAVLIAWHARWTSFLQIFPNSASIKYNTGVCFILCAVGIAILTTRFKRFATVAGTLAIVFGATALLEYSASVSAGLDQFFIRDYIYSPTDFPGRMSQLTAGCFVLLGMGLAVASAQPQRTWRLPLIAALACVVAVISIVALYGYVFGIEEAYGWGAYAKMAAHTAAAFLLLSLAFLKWTTLAPDQQRFDLKSWLPIVGSITLMMMVAFVSPVSMRHLKLSYEWRMHTYDVLLHAHALSDDIAGIQRGARNFVVTGELAALEPYKNSAREAPRELSELRTLTSDNAAQASRLDLLARDITDIVTYSQRLATIRESRGVGAALRLEATGAEGVATDRALTDLQSFTDAERRLLVTRIARARDNLSSTELLLVLASILAGALLAWAHARSSAEIRRRRRVEAELQRISMLQATILNTANCAIISGSADGVVTTFNLTAERWLGYSAAEIVGKPAPLAWYDADEIRARGEALSRELGYPVKAPFYILSAKARLGQLEEGEWTLVRKDGSRFPAWRSLTRQLDTSGAVVGYVSVISDMTERKQHEVEIFESEERFRRAFDDAPIGMALVSVAGRWLKVNHALCSMLGYSNAELLEKDVQSATHRDDREPTEELIREALAGKQPPYILEKRYIRKDGSLLFVNLCVSLVRDVAGAPLYFISQIEDITQRREVERMKGEFVSTVSHELRTPLTSIRGALGLIDAGVLGKLPELAESMVKIAHQNSERLVRIINDILDIEKISSGKLEMRIESVPIAAFLEKALAVNETYGLKHDVRFILEAPAPDISAFADPERLMQVMANLLSNAAKFSPRGAQVQVRASDRGARIRVEVEDRGTGIPDAFRGRVFERFAQADSSASRGFQGTGLGLSITRELINAMDGIIGFATVAGEGTTFYFELPRTAQPLRSPQPLQFDAANQSVLYRSNSEAPPHLAGTPRILYVEDDLDLSLVLGAALAGRAEIVTAASLQAAEKLLREESFSMLVLDLGLPDGNGLSLLEELPALIVKPMPVVILSASDVPSEVRHRVAAALVKSRASESHIVTTILSLLPTICLTEPVLV